MATFDDLDNQINGTIIHSDNFQALNLLQAKYQGQVKCIYIDPPYNTEKDRTDGKFIYKDGYPHSTWLSLMYSRIELSIPYLSKNSSFFASIDDNEVIHLKHILNQQNRINFVGSIVWEAKTKSQNTKDSYDKLQPKVEYILSYSTQEKARFNLIEKGKKEYPLQDEKGVYRIYKVETMGNDGMRGRETMVFPILGIYPPQGQQWKIGQDTTDKFIERNDVFLDDNNVPCFKMRPDDERNEITEPFWAFIDKSIGTAESAKGNLKQIITNHGIETVKPFDLIKKLSYHATDKNALILDYFAGSGTTAHAVINLNREDGGNRKFILVEQGEYFNTVLKPRIQKVIFAKDYKDGKPVADKDGQFGGISQIVKVLKLESYEDTLNNLELKRSDLFDRLPENTQNDYVLNYMLDIESRESLLNVADFVRPFDYQLNITTDSAGAYVRQKIDLVETFNYLIGATVLGITDRREKEGVVEIECRLPHQTNDDKTLIFWRDCQKVGYDDIKTLFAKRNINPKESQYQEIYINGDHTLDTVWENADGTQNTLKIKSIEQAFLDLMFGEI